MNWDVICADAQLAMDRVGRCDAIITDPPYSSGARRDADRQVRTKTVDPDAEWFSHDHMTTWGYQWLLRAVMDAARPRLDPGSHVYVFCDWRQMPNVYGILESTGYRVNNCLVWKKSNFGLGNHWRNQHEFIVFASLGTAAPMRDRGRGTVLEAGSVPARSRKHPTEKPIKLIDQIVSAQPGQRILDPFCGSGVVGVSALRYGRNFVGIDVDPAHCAEARARIGETEGLTVTG